VAVTEGILRILNARQLEGVLAHELSHVRNRDILIGSVAAAIGMSITFLARFALFFGGGDERRGGGIGLIFAWLLAPIAAAIVQMAVSRSREYQADESGAYLSHDPEALASALRKLEVTTRQVPAPASLSPAEAHLFIMNPLAGRRGTGFASLFSTHPPTDKRIERLDAIARSLGSAAPDRPDR
jgi:heat shock protein HtpX